jgi:hypothetical protein
VNITEAKALETILRSTPGYVAAPRGVASTSTGPSIYDRILVMATTSAPAAASASRPTPANTNPALNGTQRFVPPQRRATEQAEQAEQEEPDENPPNPPVFTFPPQQGQQQFNQSPMFNGAPPQNGQQVTFQINPQTGAPEKITINPSQPAMQQPTMPTGAATPGVIIAPPEKQQPPQPGSMIRPPGQKQQ